MKVTYSAHCKNFLFNRDEQDTGDTTKNRVLLELYLKCSALSEFDVILSIPFIPVKVSLFV